MEEIDEDELTIYYIDDAGRNQGPFAATVVLGWVQKGLFSDSHRIRITDNGQRIGKLFTINTTIGELKLKYGEETPIPVKIQAVLNANSNHHPVHSVGRTEIPSRVESPVRFQPFHVKPSANLKSLNRIEPQAGIVGVRPYLTETFPNDEDSEEMYSWSPNRYEKRSSSSKQDLKSGPKVPSSESESRRRLTRSHSSSSSESDGKKRKKRRKSSSPSPSSNRTQIRSKPEKVSDCKFYGPEPPPNFIRKERRSDNSSDSKKENFVKQNKYISLRNKNIPFYHKDKDDKHEKLRDVVMVELVKVIRQDYYNMSKAGRDRLHSNIKEWDLPERCERCDCELMTGSNFLGHVLSTPHLMKSCSKKKYRFTFEGDYMAIKTEIEEAKKEESLAERRSPSPSHFQKSFPRKHSAPNHSNLKSFRSEDPDFPYLTRKQYK